MQADILTCSHGARVVYVRRTEHDAAMALAEKLTTATKQPPNLRRGNAKMRCALCKHYDGRGECMKFGYPVRPTELCDSFKGKAKT